MTDVDLYMEFQDSPLVFIEHMWGLLPQPLLEEYFDIAQDAINRGAWEEFQNEWFVQYTREEFLAAGLLTWQQWIIILAVERAIRGMGSKRIAVSSGHGIGKDATTSWLILWYLFCFPNAQVPCTAPSSEQMYDVLWKELALWMRRMPQDVQDMYDWSASYVRMKESPMTWFARAKTARKEAPEALAGIHGEFVFMVVDEASGVAEEIFNTAEGALTNENILILLISNPTRLIGYFYDAFHKFKHLWQTMLFDNNDSPLADAQQREMVIVKHGIDSDEYKIRVSGQFADADSADSQGYVPLLVDTDIREIADVGGFRRGWVRMGVDPAGIGRNKTEWVIRDKFRAKIVASEDKSTGVTVAQKTISLMELYGIPDWQVTVDAFGIGGDAVQELALSGYRVNAINTGNPCPDKEDAREFINIRSMISWRTRTWLKSGHELIRNKKWKQCLYIRYRKQLSGKYKIMDKEEMRKQGIQSPDAWDALTLTFYRTESYEQTMNNDLPDQDVNAAVGVYNH